MEQDDPEEKLDTFNSNCSTFAYDPTQITSELITQTKEGFNIFYNNNNNNNNNNNDNDNTTINNNNQDNKEKNQINIEIPEKHPSLWKTHEVGIFLSNIGFSQYVKIFADNDIDGQLLMDLTGPELKEELGITVFGHRKRILQSIDFLNKKFPRKNSKNEEVFLSEMLGTGSFSSVWRGIYKNTKVAVKIILESQSGHLGKVKEEVEILSQLDCPQIVQYYNHFEKEKAVWILMECMAYSLNQVIRNRSSQELSFHPSEVFKCSYYISKGLEYLHNRRSPIIHRDLKSKNVLINLKNNFIENCKICDFGISKVTEDALAQTKTGTIRWTAPEVLLGKTSYDYSVDIWSYGMVLYELLEMKIPYKDLSQDVDIIKNISQGIPPILTEESKIKFPQYVQLFEKCLQFIPQNRPSSKELVSYFLDIEEKEKNEEEIKTVKELKEKKGNSNIEINTNNEEDVSLFISVYSKKYCILISLEKYNNPNIFGLKSCVEDFSRILLESDWNVKLFINETATLSSVENYLDVLKYQRMSSDDCLLILFSGKTIQSESENHLLFYDSTEDLTKSMTVDKFINSFGKRMPCRHILFLFDAPVGKKTEMLIPRDPKLSKSLNLSEDFDQGAVEVISSALLGENLDYSKPSTFIKFLSKGLFGDAFFNEGNGVLSASDLCSYLQRHVLEESNGHQTVSYEKLGFGNGKFHFWKKPLSKQFLNNLSSTNSDEAMEISEKNAPLLGELLVEDSKSNFEEPFRRLLEKEKQHEENFPFNEPLFTSILWSAPLGSPQEFIEDEREVILESLNESGKKVLARIDYATETAIRRLVTAEIPDIIHFSDFSEKRTDNKIVIEDEIGGPHEFGITEFSQLFVQGLFSFQGIDQKSNNFFINDQTELKNDQLPKLAIAIGENAETLAAAFLQIQVKNVISLKTQALSSRSVVHTFLGEFYTQILKDQSVFESFNRAFKVAQDEIKDSSINLEDLFKYFPLENISSPICVTIEGNLDLINPPRKVEHLPSSTFCVPRHDINKIVTNLLKPEIRVCYIYGSIGCGKTTIGIQVAKFLATRQHFVDGVLWLDLNNQRFNQFIFSLGRILQINNNNQEDLLAKLSILQHEALLVFDHCDGNQFYEKPYFQEFLNELLKTTRNIKLFLIGSKPPNEPVEGSSVIRISELSIEESSSLLTKLSPSLAPVAREISLQVENNPLALQLVSSLISHPFYANMSAEELLKILRNPFVPPLDTSLVESYVPFSPLRRESLGESTSNSEFSNAFDRRDSIDSRENFKGSTFDSPENFGMRDSLEIKSDPIFEIREPIEEFSIKRSFLESSNEPFIEIREPIEDSSQLVLDEKRSRKLPKTSNITENSDEMTEIKSDPIFEIREPIEEFSIKRSFLESSNEPFIEIREPIEDSPQINLSLNMKTKLKEFQIEKQKKKPIEIEKESSYEINSQEKFEETEIISGSKRKNRFKKTSTRSFSQDQNSILNNSIQSLPSRFSNSNSPIDSPLEDNSLSFSIRSLPNERKRASLFSSNSTEKINEYPFETPTFTPYSFSQGHTSINPWERNLNEDNDNISFVKKKPNNLKNQNIINYNINQNSINLNNQIQSINYNINQNSINLNVENNSIQDNTIKHQKKNIKKKKSKSKSKAIQKNIGDIGYQSSPYSSEDPIYLSPSRASGFEITTSSKKSRKILNFEKASTSKGSQFSKVFPTVVELSISALPSSKVSPLIALTLFPAHFSLEAAVNLFDYERNVTRKLLKSYHQLQLLAYGSSGYIMHELVRESLEKKRFSEFPSDFMKVYHARFIDYYKKVLENCNDKYDKGDKSGTIIFDKEHHNFELALKLSKIYFPVQYVEIAIAGRSIFSARYNSQERVSIYSSCLKITHEGDFPELETQIRINLGYALERTGDFDAAMDHYNIALNRVTNSKGNRNEEVAVLFKNLGLLYANHYFKKSNLDKAQIYLQKALDLRQELLGMEHPETAQSFSHMATLKRRLRQYSEAEDLYKKSLGILQNVLGRNNVSVARVISNLGKLYSLIGKEDESESYYLKAIRIWRKLKHPDLCNSLINLATLYIDQKKFTHAELLLREAYELRLHESPLDLATVLSKLSQVLIRQEKIEKAKITLEESLDLRYQHSGKDHFLFKQDLNTLKQILEKRNNSEDIKRLERKYNLLKPPPKKYKSHFPRKPVQKFQNKIWIPTQHSSSRNYKSPTFSRRNFNNDNNNNNVNVNNNNNSSKNKSKSFSFQKKM